MEPSPASTSTIAQIVSHECHTIRENIDPMTLRLTTEIRLAGTKASVIEALKVIGKAWRTTLCVYLSDMGLACSTGDVLGSLYSPFSLYHCEGLDGSE
jgi:hypothetical protein